MVQVDPSGYPQRVLKTHIDDETPVLIHENVRNFDYKVLVEELEPTGRKLIFFEHLDADDCGVEGLQRWRRVDVALLLSKVRELTEQALENLPIGEMLAEVWDSEHVWYLTEEIFLRESKGNKNRGVFHQDTSLAPWEGEHWANFWISFDPVPDENGLEFLKGTHLGPQYDYVPYDPEDPSNQSKRGKPFWGDKNDPPWQAAPDFEGILAKDPTAWVILSWGVEPGDVVVFHPHVVHGGAPTGPRYPRRRTLSLRFFGDKSYFKPIPPGGVGQTEEMHEERIWLEKERATEKPLKMQAGDLWRGPQYLQLR